MGLFFNFNKEKDEKLDVNSYIEDQQSVFNTEGEKQQKIVDNSYDEYVYKPKDYSNVPKYEASGSKKLDIVIDKDALGFQELNPEIKTVNVVKKNLHDDLAELVDNGYIDDSTNTGGTSIYDESIKDIIKKDEPIEILEIEDDVNTVFSNFVEEDIDKSKKLSIFGVSDEPIQAKIYDVKEAPKVEKPEVIEPIIEEKKEEVKSGFCPQCGAPLAQHATTCFLCGKKL